MLQGDFEVADASDLERIRECEEIAGSLNIVGTELTSVPELRLQRIRGTLGIVANPLLVDISGLSQLEVVDGTPTVGGLSLRANPQLENLSGLQSLTTVGGTVAVTEHEGLESFELASLVSVGFDFVVSRNAAGVEISAPALESVGHDVVISGNAQLASLDVESLRDAGELFRVTSNPVLPTCAARAVLDQLTARGWTGRVDIADNLADSCN